MRCEVTSEIACSPAQLWPWLSEPERMVQWMKGLEELVPDAPGPVRAGATYRMRIREGRKLAEYREEMLVYEPHRRIHVKITGGSFGSMAFLSDYELTDLGGGRTRLRNVCASQGGSRWFALLTPLFKIFAGIQARSFFRRLKRLAEGEARGGAGAGTGSPARA